MYVCVSVYVWGERGGGGGIGRVRDEVGRGKEDVGGGGGCILKAGYNNTWVGWLVSEYVCVCIGRVCE